MKRIVCILLVLVMVIALVACGGGTAKENTTAATTAAATTKSSEPAPAETPEITVMMGVWNIQTNQDSALFKKWAEDTGVKLVTKNVIDDGSDDWANKVMVTLSSGDIPDIIQIHDANVLNEYGMKGMFVPLDTQMDKVTNLKKWIDMFPAFTKIAKATDNHIYGFPKFNEIVAAWGMPQIRADILKKGGMDVSEIKTSDDFLKALRILKIQLGGKAPWVTRFKDDIGLFGQFFGTLGNYSPGLSTNVAQAFVYYNYEDKTYKFAPFDQNFKTFIEFMHTAYKEGLLHKDYLTLGDDPAMTKIQSGDAAFFIDGPGNQPAVDKSITDPAEIQKKLMEIWPVVKPWSVNGKTYKIAIDNPVNYSRPFAISAKSKNLDKALEMMDYLYSDAGIDLFSIGIEGITYKKDPSSPTGGINWLIKIFNFNPDATIGYGFDYCVTAYNTVNIAKYGINKSFLSGDVRYASNTKVYEDAGAFRDPDPTLNFTDDETDSIKDLKSQVATFVNENMHKFIMGTKDMSEYDAWVKQLEGMNAAKIVDVYNAALDRWNKK